MSFYGERFPEANGFPPGYEPTGPPGRFVEEVYTEETIEEMEWEEGRRSARMLGLTILAALAVIAAIAWILWPR